MSEGKGQNFKPGCPCSRHEGVSWNGDITPLILNLDTRRIWMIGFTLRPLYIRETTPGTFLN